MRGLRAPAVWIGALGLFAIGCGGKSIFGPLPDGGALPDSGSTYDGGEQVLGSAHQGQYNLGPVEWSGSYWNACAPYPSAVETVEGDLLAGLSNALASSGSLCDACIDLTTGQGREQILRVVTYGVSNADGDVDLSQAAYSALSAGEYPRSMSWKLVSCPTSDPLSIQFQTGANVDWTSFWVRNPRVAVSKIEVQSSRHTSWFALTRGTDGTFTDSGGFGSGAFTLRITGLDGAQMTQTFSAFNPGDLLPASGNLP